MANIPSLPDQAQMYDLALRFGEQMAPLFDLAEHVLRGSASELTIQQRETLFAYGSAMNQCSFCHLSHKYTASRLGMDEAAFEALLADIDSAPVEARMKPLFHYVRKLTLAPARMTAADSQAVLDAGWSEEALFDAAMVCGLHNFFNRLVDGFGITAGEEDLRKAGERLSAAGYAVINQRIRARKA